ncbi:MAG: hypothetical protein AAB407_02260 [Patescibacteria group bacterium]
MDVEFKKKVSIELAIVFGIIAILFVGTLALGFDMKRRSEQITMLYDELGLELEALDSLVLLREDARKAKPYADLFGTLLPSQNELIAFPKYFRDLAATQGLKPSFIFGTESARTEETLGFIYFSASLTGNPSAILAFLDSLKKGSYFVSVESIDLSVKGTASIAEIGGKIFSQ